MAARDRSGRPQNGNSRHYQEAPGSYNAAFNRGSFQRLDTSSPRPSSVGSVQSVQGLSTRGPRPNQPICIGEEVRIGIHLTVERFKLSENQKELEFPSSLSATERAYIHRLCDDLGMKSKSRGKAANRFLTIYKKDSNQAVSSASGFQLSRNSRQQAVSLLQRFPLSNKERQDLQPKTQKSPLGEVTREFSKMTTGRLNNGVPQVPPSRNETDLDVFREGLPIQQLKEDIIYATNHNQVLLVAGETGSGKTTQVPQMILDDCNKNNKPCRIFCTQPRRIAALSIAERVAQERGERIGQTVGYQIRLESKVSPKTLLTFCTNGVLLRTLMGGDNALGTLTHIIVDEVHERDRISDFLLAVVKDLLHKYKNLRLILMSAALNTEMFIKYFSGCPVAYVPGTLFPVEEHFLEDVLKWTGYSNKKMEKYRRELSKVKSQQEHLDEWCTQGVSSEGRRASMDEDFTADRILGEERVVAIECILLLTAGEERVVAIECILLLTAGEERVVAIECILLLTAGEERVVAIECILLLTAGEERVVAIECILLLTAGEEKVVAIECILLLTAGEERVVAIETGEEKVVAIECILLLTVGREKVVAIECILLLTAGEERGCCYRSLGEERVVAIECILLLTAGEEKVVAIECILLLTAGEEKVVAIECILLLTAGEEKVVAIECILLLTAGEERLGEEQEDLEPWVVKEMDKLLSEVWLSGEEEVFSQIFHLIMAENVSVDYKHSETSATPLMIAAGRGLSVTVEQLLNLGANINVRASNEWTALDWAKKFNRNDIVEMLEAYVASIECGSASEDGKEDAVVSAEDREILNVYHHSFDDEKVDTDLISALIYAIMSSKKEGAILVFLPGYDDIVTLRDIIAEDKKFESFRYVLYTLHSSIQSNDQRKVFKMAPQGVRKIILSTNIAETSVTVNDVVFVIDSGKVKEKSFDALSSCSMLKSNWVSKASCLQRKGRAGRCRPGVCYHMFSRIRYSSMQEYQQPEILRYPLQELCLNTKLLAPVNMSIADFLAKCPEPPSFLVTRNAVQLLKQMDALDTWEDLTELGHHLTDLPVEPRLGKMVLYSVVLKCLDPILTIVCALAYKDPFTLPSQPHQKRSAAMARRKFASGTFSDHMALLRAFQAWQKARTEGWERSFCDRNFLSSACMEMIVGMRTQLLGQLRASGFVRARGGGDIRDLNTNSENWAVVKAALCAGMYPNIACVDRNRNVVVTQKESKVRFHSQSVLSPAPTTEWVNGASTHAKSVRMLQGDWLIYEEMTRFNKMASAKCCTVLSAVAVAIFAGPSKLPTEAIREAEGIHEHEAGDGMYADHSSDSEGEDKEDLKKSTLQLDDWLCFRLDKEKQLRPKWPWSQMDEAVVRAVINVLTNEEQSQGLQQPAGIGQRPRPMSAESMMISGNSRGYIEADDNQGKYNNRKYPGTPPKRKEINLKGSKTSEDRLETSSVHSNSASNSSANSLKGSAGSTPCPSPQPSSPSKWAERDPGGTSSHPCRLFVMKCNNQKNLDISLQKGLWATSVSNEKKLNKAFQDGKTVYLIFSIQGSGHFQGYAKMLSEIRKDKSQDFISPGLSGSFAIEWVKRAMIPFQSTHHLTNPWNENKKVQVSRDGQEIEPSVGEALLKLWDKYPNYQKRSSPSSGTKVILKHNNSAPPKLLSKDCDMPEQKDSGDSDGQAESGPPGTATKSSSSASLTRSNSSTSSQGSGHSSNTPTSQQGHYQGSHGGQGHYQGHGHNHHQQQQNRVVEVVGVIMFLMAIWDLWVDIMEWECSIKTTSSMGTTTKWVTWAP
ncbi:3'-5' RNA helicase YTHDC2-like [Haliotis rubra]|uniref:3'-5' RNA helicase YTHDC2-like n=1 Tax=Haliotis rubra TaxID=36100 RepID=UPI001EE5FED1|nr:3'-5' RNA helicase YTHDC2-like [Haliotis rubra]